MSSKVVAFCDISESKVGTSYHNSRLKVSIPIVHFSEAKPPIVCCVAKGRTGKSSCCETTTTTLPFPSSEAITLTHTAH